MLLYYNVIIIDALISNTEDKIVSDYECFGIIPLGTVDDAINNIR